MPNFYVIDYNAPKGSMGSCCEAQKLLIQMVEEKIDPMMQSLNYGRLGWDSYVGRDGVLQVLSHIEHAHPGGANSAEVVLRVISSRQHSELTRKVLETFPAFKREDAQPVQVLTAAERADFAPA